MKTFRGTVDVENILRHINAVMTSAQWQELLIASGCPKSAKFFAEFKKICCSKLPGRKWIADCLCKEMFEIAYEGYLVYQREAAAKYAAAHEDEREAAWQARNAHKLTSKKPQRAFENRSFWVDEYGCVSFI